VEPPEIHYARSGDVAIAYQVVGHGPVDLVYVPLNLSIAVSWDQPVVAEFYERLATFSRLILLDKRGTGISDRPRALPTLESQMDDVRAVLDAVGSEQAVLFGGMHGAQMCALFAATYPERTSALILYNAVIRVQMAPDERRAWLRQIRESWGSEASIDRLLQQNYPSHADDPEFKRWYARAVRISASPGSAYEFLRTFVEGDIGDVLQAIRVPTLVMYRRELETAGGIVRDLAEQSQTLADSLPNAQLVSVAGLDVAPYVGSEVVAEVERFLSAPEAPLVPDRVLATVLFTDIVGSTEQAARLGDHGWRELLTTHRRAVRRELARFRGEEVDTAGDGFFATFDGPARAIECTREVIDSAASLDIALRAGLHTGESEVTPEGLHGIAVHLAARVVAMAGPGEILVTSTVKDLVAGSGISFRDRGSATLKGIPGEQRIFAVDGSNGSAARI
jgi:class 3 adenylate cyclase